MILAVVPAEEVSAGIVSNVDECRAVSGNRIDTCMIPRVEAEHVQFALRECRRRTGCERCQCTVGSDKLIYTRLIKFSTL